MIAEANQHLGVARGFVDKINDLILFPLIALLMGVALLVFIWGAFQFVLKADSEEARSTGKRHMIYGILGLLVMVSAYAILRIVAATFGVSPP